MLASYSSSLAPGTLANRRKQAAEYVKFALLYQVPLLAPSPTQVCMFAQRLANLHASPASVKNYISGAKNWIVDHCGSVQGFFAPQLATLLKAFTKKSSHIPSRAAPLQPHHLSAICELIDSSPSAPLAVKPALLIGYACFLRTSNLLSPTMLEWGGPHTLLAKDIRETASGLQVFIRSTKTRSAPQGTTFFVPEVPGSHLCPLQAWTYYKARVRPWALGPAFLHMNRLPITSSQVVKLMRLALKDHTDIIPERVSMHSIRRGATQAAVDQGVPLTEIQATGTWNSPSGMRPYLSP